MKKDAVYCEGAEEAVLVIERFLTDDIEAQAETIISLVRPSTNGRKEKLIQEFAWTPGQDALEVAADVVDAASLVAKHVVEQDEFKGRFGVRIGKGSYLIFSLLVEPVGAEDQLLDELEESVDELEDIAEEMRHEKDSVAHKLVDLMIKKEDNAQSRSAAADRRLDAFLEVMKSTLPAIMASFIPSPSRPSQPSGHIDFAAYYARPVGSAYEGPPMLLDVKDFFDLLNDFPKEVEAERVLSSVLSPRQMAALKNILLSHERYVAWLASTDANGTPKPAPGAAS
jgi:hypothetical protein